MFKIDKDVANKPKKRGRKAIYPFGEMNVYDSFFIPCDGQEKAVQRRASVAAAGRLALGRGTLSTSVREEYGVWGVRVWRVK